jgi:hypothetical protein
MYGREKNSCSILVRKPEREILHGRLWLIWEDNFKMYLKDIKWDVEDWIRLAQNRTRFRVL